VGGIPAALTARTLLYTSSGALRAPWRVVGFLAASTVCTLIASVLVAPFHAALAATRVPGLADWAVILAGIGGGTAITVRWIDRRPLRDIWLDRSAATPRRLAEGCAIGLLAIGLPSILLIAVGWLSVEQHGAGSWTVAALRVSLLLLVAALAEELIFRGYLFALLRERLGLAAALAVTSVGFGYAHVDNPGASLRTLALVTLAGVFLGAMVVVLRSLYAAWLAHFAWNWAMAVLLHIPVSGLETETPDYRTIDSGPDWATGGQWGPEGGGGAAVGMIAGLGYLAARHRRGARSHG
jgi:membrane protease YdiL (CAAX protease family)